MTTPSTSDKKHEENGVLIIEPPLKVAKPTAKTSSP
jgi:hypothetical protein